MEDDDDLEMLRSMMEDFMVSIELGKFESIPRLGYKICSLLIELVITEHHLEDSDHSLDDEDQQNYTKNDTNTDDGQSQETEDTKFSIVELICTRLKELCRLAWSYSQVLDFVRVQDLICLNRMLTKNPNVGLQFDSLTVQNINIYRRTLNQSIVLLRASYREQELRTDSHDHSYFQIHSLDTGIGLPRYQLILVDSSGSKSFTLRDLISLVDGLNNVKMKGSLIGSLIETEWFKEFISRVLMRPFPLDRFSILVSLWILSTNCKHALAHQLIAELVDQIYHQETNSGQEEELTQLSQVGSFWVSYQKSYLASSKILSGQTTSLLLYQVDGDEDDDDKEDDDDDYKSSVDSTDGSARPHDAKLVDEKTGSMESALRQLIQGHLIKQEACVSCGLRPDEPLGSLADQRPCSNCGLKPHAELRCGLSLDKLGLCPLSHLLRPAKLTDRRLLILGPGEWLRARLMSRGWLPNGNSEQDPKQGISSQIREKLQLTASFQRLTVIRGQGTQSDDSSSEEDDGGHRGVMHSRAGSDKDPVAWLARQLASDKVGGRISESLGVLRSLVDRPASSLFSLLSSDVLLGEAPADGELVDDPLLRLTRDRNQDPSRDHGALWICGAMKECNFIGGAKKQNGHRLLIGCGQLFGHLELIRLGKTNSVSGESFTCPHCGHQLRRLRSLNANVTN